MSLSALSRSSSTGVRWLTIPLIFAQSDLGDDHRCQLHGKGPLVRRKAVLGLVVSSMSCAPYELFHLEEQVTKSSWQWDIECSQNSGNPFGGKLDTNL